MNRTATWASIGTDVSTETNLDGVLKRSGLDFQVVKKGLVTADGKSIPWKVATAREDTGEVLGIVSPKYEICQNRDAFDFVNYIDEDLKFVKAGMTYYGMVYIIAELPECNVLGDKFVPYVIFQNGHNGGITLKTAISPLRIVCQNQFSGAFRDTQNTISIRHNKSLQYKMEEAKKVLISVNDYMKDLTAEAERYSGIKLSQEQVDKFIDDMFVINEDMKESKKLAILESKAVFKNAYNAEDNRNFRGTGWGLINAIADYESHNIPRRKTDNWEENKFQYVAINPYLTRYMDMVSSMA